MVPIICSGQLETFNLMENMDSLKLEHFHFFLVLLTYLVQFLAAAQAILLLSIATFPFYGKNLQEVCQAM